MKRSKTLIPTPLCFIKFSKSKYNLELLNEGKIRFNPSEIYNDDTNKQRGDKFEGSEWIYNGNLEKVIVDHPTLGKLELKPFFNQKSQVVQYNCNFLSYSLYSVSINNFKTKNEFSIDDKLLEFGDSALLIEDPIRFLRSIVSEFNRRNIQYEFNYINYVDFAIEERELNSGPFRKTKDYSHQKEFRIIIPNRDNHPKEIYLGDISEYCRIFSSKDICEMNWIGKRRSVSL
ncbi:MAG: hypothetical protein N4A71_07490 [Carboxylicivirga sp.]|jgi:hypothetical protein|nr:hypothetical protein [Carboxylicivirga sp.]